MTTSTETTTIKIDPSIALRESKLRAEHMAAYDWNRILVLSQLVAQLSNSNTELKARVDEFEASAAVEAVSQED